MASDRALRADVIVVGSGPGGATLARELTRAGKKVLLLERGIDYRAKPYYGTYLGPLIYADRASLLFTQEGLNIVRPLMLGGATSMYCGCAAPPPAWFKDRYRLDIDAEVAEATRELGVAPLPEEARGRASTRIAEAARGLGYDWQPQLKFMRISRCKNGFDCGAKCMLGCRCGAKWNAAEFADQAVAEGADLQTRAYVKKLLFSEGRCVGVEGTLDRRPFTANAPVVVLSAGGIGTPRILQASGFKRAGEGMTMDITVMVYGFSKDPGIGKEPPMTWSWENLEGRYMLSTLADPWLLFPLITALKGIKYPFYWPKWGKLLGVMIKLRDDVSGGVFPNGRISKPMTAGDRGRLKEAEQLCARILKEAGADTSTIFTTPQRGTHPSGTVRVGVMLNEHLETETPGLYVCDASVFPEALGRPTVLTIIGLAKRLAKRLAGQPAISKGSSDESRVAAEVK